MLMMVLVKVGKGFNINFTKATAKFCLSLYYNSGESYLYVNKTDF